MTRPTLEDRCGAALTRAGLGDCLDHEDFDNILRAVMRLVQRERRAARCLTPTKGTP